MKTPKIFISFSHLDEPEKPRGEEMRWLSFVVGFLTEAFGPDEAKIWFDREMNGGDNYRAIIDRQLKECDVFIALLSVNWLRSEFVQKVEVLAIRKRQEAGADVIFYPLLVTQIPKASKARIKELIRPSDGKPLGGYPLHERQEHMCAAADEVKELVEAQAARRAEAPMDGGSVRASVGPRELRFSDPHSLYDWFEEQEPEIAVAIAARAALRALPLLSSLYRESHPQFVSRTAAGFRAVANARVGAKFSIHPKKFGDLISLKKKLTFGDKGEVAPDSVRAIVHTIDAFASYPNKTRVADWGAEAARCAVAAARETGGRDATRWVWGSIASDATAALHGGARVLADAPLWPGNEPDWAQTAWRGMSFALLREEDDWDVWIKWYEDRLRGAVRSVAWEYAFVSLPKSLWGAPPARVNLHIKNCLAELAAVNAPLPTPVPGVASPAHYLWTALHQLAPLPGEETFPLYEAFTSPDDHRAALETARAAARAALKAVPTDARNSDLKPIATELRAYLRSLPKAVGVGNILLASESLYRIDALRRRLQPAMPDDLDIALDSLARCQTRVNPFYPIVGRFESVVPGQNWPEPYPDHSAQATRKTMRAYTPKFIAPETTRAAAQAARNVPPETLNPAGYAPPPATTPPATPEPIDPLRAHQMLDAARLNEFWKEFLQGREHVTDLAGFEQALRDFAKAITPLLGWLERAKTRS